MKVTVEQENSYQGRYAYIICKELNKYTYSNYFIGFINQCFYCVKPAGATTVLSP
jgi:hypothetical protein